MSLKTEEIIVIGNRAVGKTSLLSAMYMYMEQEGLASIGDMTFTAEDDSEYKVLVEKWNEMRRHIKTTQFTSTLNIPYSGTVATFNEHRFAFKTKKNSQTISFVDTKGGATSSLDANLIKRVNESFMTICVVDAAVLMECDEVENDERNCPKEIKRILQNVIEDGDNLQPKCCLFILTKCEKYMGDDRNRHVLANRFNKVFKTVLGYAKEKSFPLYYLPVQTMGCVEFSHINPINEEMIFRVLPLEKHPFAPKDVVFPLVFIMLWLLYTMEEGQKKWNILWKGMAWLFGWKEDFTAYNNQLRHRIGVPTDFRSNMEGAYDHMRECKFWKD